MSTTDWVCRLMGTAQPPPVTEVADGSTRAERSTEATPSFETPTPPMSMNELIRARPQIELGHLEIEVKVTSTLERQSFSAQRVSAVLSSAAGLQQPVAWHNDPPRAAFRFGSPGVARPGTGPARCQPLEHHRWPNRYDGCGEPGSLVGAQLTLPVVRRRR